MALQNAVRYFTEETQLLSSMAIACGDATRRSQAIGGIADSAQRPVTEDTLYDLASLTKLMTGLMVMRLREEGLLDLSAPVTRYAPAFENLSHIAVDTVLGFETGLVTPERVDAQADRASGLAMLHRISPRSNGDGRAYSDMHAMVLKEVIEGAAGQSYMDALRARILRPLGMERTVCRVPNAWKPLCASFDGEHRIEGDRYILRRGIEKGTPHDPKARLLNAQGDDCCGHAGLFAPLGDMVLLAQGVLRGSVVSRESLAFMARNRTGRRLEGGGYTQFLGSQCYVKHPELYYSEIPLYESDQAIGLSGFTGHHLSIDPKRGVFALFLGNRVLNRLTVLTPPQGKTLMDYGLAPDGVGAVLWPDGTRVQSSVQYVHHKDAHFHNEVARELGL